MCGIAGVIGIQQDVEKSALNLVTSLRHRGPDEAGVYFDDNVLLVHTRLSIVDLQHGTQPVMLPPRQEVLVFNGEIFNAAELRDYLALKGIALSSHSDTVILYHLLYLEGESAVNKLNGQFAFCFYSPDQRRCILARDGYGEKPLYYYHDGERLIFGSEIKAIRQVIDKSLSIDLAQLSSVNQLWATLPDKSLFNDIHQLSPGEILIWQESAVSKAWFQTDLSKVGDSVPIPGDVKSTFHTATKNRLMSDVEVGVMLSGGLDSSIVASEVAGQNKGKHLKCFSVGFDDKDFDEGIEQRLVAEKLGADLVRVNATPQSLLDNLDSAIWHAECVSPRFAFVAMYLLHQKVAEQGIRVMLTGEAADEIFLGYDLFRETLIRQQIKLGATFEQVRPMLESLNAFMRGQSKYHEFIKLKYANYASLAANEGPLSSHDQRQNMAATMQGIIATEEGTFSIEEDWLAYFTRKYQGFMELPGLKRAQIVEVESLLTGHLLSTQGDRMSMAHGVETRTPFLDRFLLDSVNNYQQNVLLSSEKQEKWLLRDAYKAVLPTAVTEKQKFPFRAPETHYFLSQSGVREECLQRLGNISVLSHLINVEKAQNLVSKIAQKQNISPRQNHLVVMLLTLESLTRQFCNGAATLSHQGLRLQERVSGQYGRCFTVGGW